MKVFIVMLREEIIANPENNSYDIYNDYILKVFDSEEKAIKFCESISGVIKGDYIIQDISKLYPYCNIIGYILGSAEYEVYIVERDVE